MGSIVAEGSSDSIGCRFVVNGAGKAETNSHDADACPVRLVKSA
ncbi:MmpS family transport accessory protein [Mycobacterium sp.]